MVTRIADSSAGDDTLPQAEYGDSILRTNPAPPNWNTVDLLTASAEITGNSYSNALRQFPDAGMLLDQLKTTGDSRVLPSTQSDHLVAGLPIPDFIRNAGEYQNSRNNRVAPEAAGRVLEAHNLRGSFTSQVLSQLERDGKVRVGIIDDFSTDHARAIEARLRGSLPDYIRDRVEIVRFDTSGGRHQAFQNAIDAANNKTIAALSVSGGLETVNLNGLERSLGVTEINASNRARALDVALRRFENRSDYDDLREDMIGLSMASSRIPIVTPGWNDGNITPATLGRNTIVTSLTGTDNHATQSGLIDMRIEALSTSGYTSQTPPRVIGAMFGLVSEDQVRRATQRR